MPSPLRAETRKTSENLLYPLTIAFFDESCFAFGIGFPAITPLVRFLITDNN